MLRLNRIALIVGALLAPFAASGLVVLVAGWLEAITGDSFPIRTVTTGATLAAIVAAVAAVCAVLALWDET